MTKKHAKGTAGTINSCGTNIVFHHPIPSQIAHPALKVKGDADFEGDITIKGKSLSKMLDGFEKRLAILIPDPAKLEQFEALKKAYEQYKMLEALCESNLKGE